MIQLVLKRILRRSGPLFFNIVIYKTCLLSALLLLTIHYQSFAQDNDVTSTYLTNAGFDTNCNYLSGATGTVSTADPGNLATVTGWTISSAPAWSAGGTFEYGWNGSFNSVTTPASGSDASTGSGHGALGLTAGWTGNIAYDQQVTLPPGNYTIEFAACFKGATQISANTTGWVPNSGTAVFSDLTTVGTLGTWTTNTVDFTVLTETTGKIQVGMQAFNSGSTSNGRMFVDYVKLISHVVDKTELQNLVDSANYLLANQQQVPDGSTAYTDLANTVSSVQAILDNAAATTEEIFAAQDQVEAAIDVVYAAILASEWSGSGLDNPTDITDKMINPDFELNGGSTTGWTTGLGIYNGTNAVFIGAPNPNHVMDGDPASSTTGYQTVNILPAGVYQIKAIARGRTENGPKMFIGAVSGSVFGSTNRVRVEVDRIGDTGGDLNYGFNQYETPYVIIPDGVTTLTLGIYFSGDCGWSSVDNFELYYCGGTEAYINQLKAQLTVLRDSSNMPTGYDNTDVNNLLSTELTSENSISLAADLNEAIGTLKIVIAENMDATLVDIKVDGISLRDFSSSVEAYDYHLYSSSPDIPGVPPVTATTNSAYAATPVITDAGQVPGTTSITVTAGNGDTKTYTINFDFIQLTVHENYTATLETLEGNYLELSGKGLLTVTGTTDTKNTSAVNFVSADTWIYFPNMRPSQVAGTSLYNMRVNGEFAVIGTNIRVTNYLNGAMVIPHSPSYKALTVYSGSGLSGSSKDLVINQRYKTSELGTMNDNIESFVLRRGYMATFASNANGTGTSRVYIAKDKDIIVNVMPEGLSNTVSFVVVRQWRWTTKKGWRGSPSDADRFGATSSYDYNNSAYSTLDVEYVPMRHNPGWNAYSNFLDKYSSTHALGYNEPDNSVDDGFSTVEDAIANWPNMMESGLRLGSPAPTDGGLSWLYDFMNQCDVLGYRVDFVAWHFYRRGYTAQGLYNTLRDIHNTTGRPLWITEFNNGCNWTYDASNPVPTLEQNAATIEAFINMLDTTSFVERYFVWDGCNETLRMTNSGTGALYPAGVAYRDLVSTMSYTSDYYNDLGVATIQENSTGFCGVDGTIDTDHSYTGSGFANTTDAVGSGVDYKVIFSSEGPKTISVQYASTENRPANIIINGEILASDVQFPSTGSLDNYANVQVMLTTGTGIADIRIEATTASGLANIDYIEVTDARAADCSMSSDSYPVILRASSEQDGNPADNILDGNNADDSRWSAAYFPQTVVIDYGENKSIVGTKVWTYQDRAYQFTIELDDNADFSSPYTVDRSNNTGSGQPISDNFASVTARYAKITVTGAYGYTGTWVSITEFDIVEGPSAVKDHPLVSGNDKLILYPNPATDHVYINIPDGFKNSLLSVCNSTGQTVKMITISSKNELVNTVDLSAGIYMIKLVADDEVLTGKLIIE